MDQSSKKVLEKKKKNLFAPNTCLSNCSNINKWIHNGYNNITSQIMKNHPKYHLLRKKMKFKMGEIINYHLFLFFHHDDNDDDEEDVNI